MYINEVLQGLACSGLTTQALGDIQLTPVVSLYDAHDRVEMQAHSTPPSAFPTLPRLPVRDLLDLSCADNINSVDAQSFVVGVSGWRVDACKRHAHFDL